MKAVNCPAFRDVAAAAAGDQRVRRVVFDLTPHAAGHDVDLMERHSASGARVNSIGTEFSDENSDCVKGASVGDDVGPIIYREERQQQERWREHMTPQQKRKTSTTPPKQQPQRKQREHVEEELPDAVRTYFRYCFAVPGGSARLLYLDTLRFLRAAEVSQDADVVELAAHLSALGYEARVEHTDDRETKKFLASAVKHTFIVVTFASGEEYAVDIAFREQFSIPRMTRRYATAYAAVPEVFVGTRPHLLCAARAMWREMELSFTRHGMTPLPPWRKETSFLARWKLARARWDDRSDANHDILDGKTAVRPISLSQHNKKPEDDSSVSSSPCIDAERHRTRRAEEDVGVQLRRMAAFNAQWAGDTD